MLIMVTRSGFSEKCRPLQSAVFFYFFPNYFVRTYMAYRYWND